MASLNLRRRGASDETGAELIEFAFALPLMLLVLLGIVDFGFTFQQYEVVTNAAREGARIGVLPGYGAGDVDARVAAYVSGSGLAGTPTTDVAYVALTPANSPPFNAVQVTVSYPHRFTLLDTIAGMFDVSLPPVLLTSAATMRVEGP